MKRLLSLKKTRESQKLLQHELAKMAGISAAQISNLERGLCTPHKTTCRKIEAIIGRVDWTAESKVKLVEVSFVEVQRTLKQLRDQCLLMNKVERDEIKELVRKYF